MPTNFPIGDDIAPHAREFAEATVTERRKAGLLEGARAMALTVLDLVNSPSLRDEVRVAAGRGESEPRSAATSGSFAWSGNGSKRGLDRIAGWSQN